MLGFPYCNYVKPTLEIDLLNCRAFPALAQPKDADVRLPVLQLRCDNVVILTVVFHTVHQRSYNV